MSVATKSRSSTLWLLAILGLYVAIGVQYAALTPAWQVPDEPAHYNYIRHIATTSTLPVLQAGDYDQAYLSELTSTGFPPDRSVDSLRYEGHQPPLYYLLAAPVYLVTGGALLPLRLVSLALGAGVVLLTYHTMRELFPGTPALALSAAGFVAFLPQHVAMMAGVNNDSLAELVIAATLWTTIVWLRPQAGHGNTGNTRTASRYELPIAPYVLLVGLLVGAAFVTKATAYVVAPTVATAVWLRGRREAWEAKRYDRAFASIFGPALIIGALWWGRNLAVYGWPDFLGLIRHDQIVVGQPRTAEWLALYDGPEFARRFAQTTFQSFWGQFGWMGVPMDSRIYWTLLAFSLLILAGLAYTARPWIFRDADAAAEPPDRPAGTIPQPTGRDSGRALTRTRLAPQQRDGLTVLLICLALTIALYLYYNIGLVQHQGRYLFPALIPISLGVAIGLSGCADIAPTAIRRWLPLGAIGLLAALDLIALYRFIVPALPNF